MKHCCDHSGLLAFCAWKAQSHADTLERRMWISSASWGDCAWKAKSHADTLERRMWISSSSWGDFAWMAKSHADTLEHCMWISSTSSARDTPSPTPWQSVFADSVFRDLLINIFIANISPLTSSGVSDLVDNLDKKFYMQMMQWQWNHILWYT